MKCNDPPHGQLLQNRDHLTLFPAPSSPQKVLISWDNPQIKLSPVASVLYLPLDIMVDFLHFIHEPILHHVSAKLYIWTVSPGLQTSLSHLGWPLLIHDSFPQSINIFCLRVDLLHQL